MARPKSNGSGAQSAADIGFEIKLWLTEDKLLNMGAAEFKRLGLLIVSCNFDDPQGHRHKRLSGHSCHAVPNSEAPLRQIEVMCGRI